MTDQITCTRRELDLFWDDTFTDWSANVYLDDGGPSEDDWMTDDPDHVMSFHDGDLAWQDTDDIRWRDLGPVQARKLDAMMQRGLRALFLHWRQTTQGDRITVVVQIPASASAQLDTWLKANDGTRQ